MLMFTFHTHRRVRGMTPPQTRVYPVLGFGRQYTSMKRPHLWFKDRWNLCVWSSFWVFRLVKYCWLGGKLVHGLAPNLTKIFSGEWLCIALSIYTYLQEINAVKPYKLRKDLISSKTVSVWFGGNLFLVFPKTHVVTSLSPTRSLLFCLKLFLQCQSNHIPLLQCVNLR